MGILVLLTTHAPCVEAMVADRSNVLLSLQVLHLTHNFHEGTLKILYTLASTPELSWFAAKQGGVLYILELLFLFLKKNILLRH